MVHRKAARRMERLSGLTALLLLALGTSTNPALASTSADTRCDQSVESPAMPDVHPGNLTLEVVDHGVSESGMPAQTSVNNPVEYGGSSNSSADDRSRVDTLLRRVFDEPRLRAPEVPAPEKLDERSSTFVVDEPEKVEKPATTVPGDEVSDVTPRLPGVSGDELLRLKQQMYRTDI